MSLTVTNGYSFIMASLGICSTIVKIIQKTINRSFLMKYYALLFIPLFTVACVNTSTLYTDYSDELEQTIPATWVSEFVEGSIETNWLNQLHDEQLVEVVRAGITNNLAIKQSAAKVGSRYAQANVVAGGRLPSFHLNLGANRKRFNDEASVTGETLYTNLFSMTLQMTWNLDFWGNLRSSEKAALYQYQAAFANYQFVLNTTAATIARNWYSLTAQTQLNELDAQKVFASEKLLQQARSRYQLGLQSAYELYNQEARIFSYQRQQLQGKKQLRDIQRQLEQLLGRYPSAQITAQAKLPQLQDNIPAGLPSEILQNRADLIAAQAQLKASYESVAEARGNRFPSIQLTTSLGRSSDDLSNLTNNGLTIFSLGSSLTLPLFAFGTLEAKEALARATAEQQELQYKQDVHKAFLEVEKTLDAEQSYQEQVSTAQQASVLYRQAADTVEGEYRNGTSDFTTWANAEISSYDSDASVITLQRDSIHNRIDLYLALGGTFSESILQSVTDIVPESARNHTSKDSQ